MKRAFVAVLFAVVCGSALAAPPEVPAQVTAPAGKVKEIVVKADKGKDFGFRLVGGSAAFREMKADDPNERVFWLITDTDSPLSIVWWTVGEKASTVTEVNRGRPVPPKPDDPQPKPDDPPAPVPVTSFRVFVVYESGPTARVTENQFGVVFGRQVEEYLDAACGKDADGGRLWRRRDQHSTSGGSPALEKFWTDVKGKVPSVPCLAVQVNDGKPQFIPIGPMASVEGTISELKKLRGK